MIYPGALMNFFYRRWRGNNPFIKHAVNNLISVYRSEVFPRLFSFDGLFISIPKAVDYALFWEEARDILLGEILGAKTVSMLHDEGPYELGKHVCLSPGDVVIDAGANMGMFSAIAAYKGCKVFAFEPNPSVIEEYLSHLAQAVENIHIVPKALAAQSEDIFLDIHASIAATSTINYDNSSANAIKVAAITLDDFVVQNEIPRVDFIKADIEGAERELLKGAKYVLQNFAPKIAICTYHRHDDPKVLRRLILEANPNYRIIERYKKMYAYVV